MNGNGRGRGRFRLERVAHGSEVSPEGKGGQAFAGALRRSHPAAVFPPQPATTCSRAGVSRGRGAQLHFRLYFMDGANHIARAMDLECGSEDEAIAVASRQADGRAMELWIGARRIWRHEPASGDGG